MRSLVVLMACLPGACSGTSSTPTKSTGPAAGTTATPASPDDVVVATVNGRPIYGSCVAAQAKTSKQQGLDDCIAFELLAQEAEAKKLTTDPEVTDATRVALVDRLVETDFEARYAKPSDLADVISQTIERHKEKLTRPEGRASAYVRVEVPKGAPPVDDFHAHTLASKIAARVKDEVGLMPAMLETIAKEVAAGEKFRYEVVRMMARDELVGSYADALWAIPDVGRTSPEPVHTQWGWDVILLTDVSAAKTYTREEAAEQAFPEVRRQYFNVWVNKVIKSLGVKIEVDPKQVAKLEDL